MPLSPPISLRAAFSGNPLQQIIRLQKSPEIQHDLSTASDDWCFVADPTQVTYQFAHGPSVAQFAASVVRGDEMPLQPARSSTQRLGRTGTSEAVTTTA